MDIDQLEGVRSIDHFRRSLDGLGEMGGPVISAEHLKQFGEGLQTWGDRFATAGLAITLGALGPEAVPAGGPLMAAGTMAAQAGKELQKQAQAQADAERKAKERAAMEEAEQQRERDLIRDYHDSRFDHLDSGQTSRNDQADRMDRFGKIA